MVFKRNNKNPSQDAVLASRKGLETIRSPELKKAWLDQDKIRSLYENGATVKEICELYQVNYRSVYRIIK